jgi:type I restriction enzyme S subunit
VGDAAIATDSDITAAFPDTMIRLQPDPQLCLPAYLLLCWRSPDMRSQIEQSAKTTAGIYKINQRDISGYRVALPDIESQRSILQEVERRFSVLDQVEAIVTANLSRCGQLRKTVLIRALGG